MFQKIICFTLLLLFTNLLQAVETNLISKIIYVGFKNINAADLDMSIQPLRDRNGNIERAKIGTVLTNIRQMYGDKGYDIDIVPSESLTKKGIQMQLTVKEGIPHRVRFVTWITNGILSKKTEKVFEWNIYARYTTVRSLTNDQAAFLKKYRNQGRYDIRMTNITFETSEKRVKFKVVDAVISFETGPRYGFGGYAGPLLKELPVRLKKDFHKSGIILNADKMSDDLRNIRAFYVAKGFPFVRIMTNIRKEAGIISADLSLSNAKTYRYKGLNIKGLTKTKEYVIIRENPFKIGEPYSEKKRTLYDWKLEQTHFFKTHLLQPRQDGDDGFILDMRVEEQQTGMITLGAVFSSEDGFGGYERVEEYNFAGRGFHLLQEIDFMQTSRVYLIGFKAPRIAGTPFSLVLLPYYSDRAIYSSQDPSHQIHYYQSGAGFIFGSDLILDSYSKIGMLERIESKEKRSIDPALSSAVPGKHFRDATQIYLTRNTIDNYFTPHKGYGFRASWELSYGAGHNDTYMKTLFTGVGILGVTAKSSIVLNGSYGTITIPPLCDFGSVEGDDLFHLGSVDTVRGFQNETPWSSFGLTRYYVNLEYRCFIHELITALLFFDAGDQWDTWFRWYDIDLARISCSTGIGINLGVPLLPFKFVLAYPLLRSGIKPDSFSTAGFKFEFSVGWLFSSEGSGYPSFESMDYRY